MIVLLADADGDGALSIDELRSVQERAFKQADTKDDGKVSAEEIEAFVGSMQAGSTDKTVSSDEIPAKSAQ